MKFSKQKKEKQKSTSAERTLKQDIHLFMRGVRIIRSVSPGYLPLLLCHTFFSTLSPYINLYMSAFILNELLSKHRADRLLFLVIMTLTLDLIIYLIKCIFNRYIYHGRRSFLFYQQFGIHNDLKMFELDYASIEDPETHRLFNRYTELFTKMHAGLPTVANGVVNIASCLLSICFSVGIVAELLVLGVFSGSYGSSMLNSPPALLIMLILLIIPGIIRIRITSSSTKKSQESVIDMLPFKRLYQFYTSDYIGNYQTGKDIRLYNQQDIITEDMMSEYPKMVKAAGSMQNQLAVHGISENVVNSINNFFIYLFVAIRSAAGCFSIGNILKYSEGIIMLMNSISSLFNNISYIRARNECLEVLFKYLDLPNKMEQGNGKVHPDESNVYTFELRHVSFKYPDTDHWALRDVNLKFRSGERLAVVGMNGSGKTTLIKLLCRLYDPTEGEILLNGVNIRTLSYQEYIDLFGVVFQDFSLLALTLGQNVSNSEEYDRSFAEECLRLAGFGERLDTLPDGIDTYLYHHYDENGIEISGGEAQKIALARALYKRSPILILDEPTAALDPIAEADIYSRFNHIVGERTAIFISHRLSSCRFCHNIAVFDDGHLVQLGSHDDLLDNDKGKYYELWHAQAQYYKDETK